MTPTEANVLLTKAGMVDPRMRRVDPMEAADRAEAWADLLGDVSLADALEAMHEHYQSSTDALMPAHIMDRVAPVDPWAALPDVTAEVVEESRVQALAAAGVTEEEFRAHEHDAAWLRARFGTRELEGGQL